MISLESSDPMEGATGSGGGEHLLLAAASSAADAAFAQFRDQTRFWIQRVAVPLLMVIGVFGNLITVIIMTRRRMRSTTNMYLAALALVDMFYLVLTFLLGLSHYPNMAQRRYLLYWHLRPFLMMLTDACSNTSVWLTVTFTIERYIAVRYPMKGKVWCTETRARMLIICVFVLGILFAAPVPFEWKVIEKRASAVVAAAAESPPLPSSTSATTTTTTLTGDTRNSNIDADHDRNHSGMQTVGATSGDKNEPYASESCCVLALDYSDFGRNETYKTIYYWSTAVIFYFVPLFSLTLFNGYLIKSVHQSKRERNKMTIVGHQHANSATAASANAASAAAAAATASLRQNQLKQQRGNKPISTKNGPLNGSREREPATRTSVTLSAAATIVAGASSTAVAPDPSSAVRGQQHAGGEQLAGHNFAGRGHTTDPAGAELRLSNHTSEDAAACETLDASCRSGGRLNGRPVNVDSTSEREIAQAPSAESKHTRGFKIRQAAQSPAIIRSAGSNFGGHKRHQINDQQPSPAANSTVSSSPLSSQERRITIMLIAVVILFLVCQIPSAAMLLYTSVRELEPGTNEHALVLAFGNIFNFLMAVNAAGNFILYSFLSKKYRKTFVILFCYCLRPSASGAKAAGSYKQQQQQQQQQNHSRSAGSMRGTTNPAESNSFYHRRESSGKSRKDTPV